MVKEDHPEIFKLQLDVSNTKCVLQHRHFFPVPIDSLFVLNFIAAHLNCTNLDNSL